MHPGASGGALLNEHGQVVGMLTSNTKHANIGAVPNLNFSIAAAALQGIFDCAATTMKEINSKEHDDGPGHDGPGDNEALQWKALDAVSPSLQALWRLGPAPQQHVDRHKGQGFASFVQKQSRAGKPRSAL